MFNKSDTERHTYCFTCSSLQVSGSAIWKARLTCTSFDRLPYQASLSFDACSYIFFIDEYINGYYISIPSLFTAADIGPLGDYGYNKEKLLRAGLCDIEAISFAKALRIIDDLLTPDLSFLGEATARGKINELDQLYSPLPE